VPFVKSFFPICRKALATRISVARLKEGAEKCGFFEKKAALSGFYAEFITQQLCTA